MACSNSSQAVRSAGACLFTSPSSSISNAYRITSASLTPRASANRLSRIFCLSWIYICLRTILAIILPHESCSFSSINYLIHYFIHHSLRSGLRHGSKTAIWLLNYRYNFNELLNLSTMKSIWLFIIILSALLSACQSLPPSDSTNTPSRVAQSTQTSTPLPLSPTVRTASPSTPSPLSPSPPTTHT